MYKYFQQDRVSFKEEIWFTLKRFNMSANTVRKGCTDLRKYPIIDKVVLYLTLFDSTWL